MSRRLDIGRGIVAVVKGWRRCEHVVYHRGAVVRESDQGKGRGGDESLL